MIVHHKHGDCTSEYTILPKSAKEMIYMLKIFWNLKHFGVKNANNEFGKNNELFDAGGISDARADGKLTIHFPWPKRQYCKF
jgi:hypothetical protein